MIVLGIVLVVLVALGAAGAWFYTHPLEALARAGRRSLKGAGFARRSWESGAGRQIGFAAGQGPLVVLDLAGHGESEPRTGPIRVQNVVDGLDAVLKAESASGPATLARVLGEVLGGTGPGPNREAVPATGGKQ